MVVRFPGANLCINCLAFHDTVGTLTVSSSSVSAHLSCIQWETGGHQSRFSIISAPDSCYNFCRAENANERNRIVIGEVNKLLKVLLSQENVCLIEPPLS